MDVNGRHPKVPAHIHGMHCSRRHEQHLAGRQVHGLAARKPVDGLAAESQVDLVLLVARIGTVEGRFAQADDAQGRRVCACPSEQGRCHAGRSAYRGSSERRAMKNT